MKKILVITSHYDKTVDYLLEKYPETNFFRFNVDEFSNYQVSVSGSRFNISRDGVTISSESCRSIYYRKPSLEDLKEVISGEYFSYVYSEVFALVDGIADAFDGFCMTKPKCFRFASNKIVQASLAEKVGFNIPAHSITNSESSVDSIKEGVKIVKPISVGKIKRDESFEFVQTNIVDDSVGKEKLKYCPSYFQSFISKDYECRLTIVGDTHFGVKIDSVDRVDWRRPGNKVSYMVVDVPNHILEKCFYLMQLLDIEFGCFDFLIKDSEWYFLEVNVNGQWAWLELELGINISGKIIEKLECKNSVLC
ncbi:hypothetical protein EAG18_11375 [Pseudoalteromonas sp. J010]|uniref:hypothetical protein n=1 Tax=Pseudoalteromonas sp. J010 TaxID=998465 RepID=UPI000F6467E3|nr:hypothetical protein [Pseudoalteromonas sp. J010]RRS08590.1 hypothetical protein EAG18_11375 [Pseudoalteromonas sp. J010]